MLGIFANVTRRPDKIRKILCVLVCAREGREVKKTYVNTT